MIWSFVATPPPFVENLPLRYYTQDERKVRTDYFYLKSAGWTVEVKSSNVEWEREDF